jgi:tRNA (uracil-5-)-methyltransferase TRM9
MPLPVSKNYAKLPPMDSRTAAALIDLNRRFYSEFGPAFAATRQRIQNGVRRVLGQIPDEGDWLDIGCGSGALAVEWLRQRRQSSYLGLDFSTQLLDEARRAVDGLPGSQHVRFAVADLADPEWAADLPPGGFRGVLAFAVLHHLPSAGLRQRLLEQVHALLAPGGLFIHSQWQFQHAPRLMERVQPWESAGLRPDQLEPGDTLLDWRYSLPGQPEQTGLRYVHLFTHAELQDLAQAAGFSILETFESDGQGGRLGLYQVWQKPQ